MSEDAHNSHRRGLFTCERCGINVAHCAHLCPACHAKAGRSESHYQPRPLCPALIEAAWRTANLHLCLAHAEVTQARELLEMTGDAARLSAQLENVATWLDDTAIRATARRAEEVRV